MKRFRPPTADELTALWRERAGLKPEQHGPAMPPMVAWVKAGARLPWWCSNAADHRPAKEGND